MQSPADLILRTPTHIQNRLTAVAGTGHGDTPIFLEMTVPIIPLILADVVWLPNETHGSPQSPQNGVHISLSTRRSPIASMYKGTEFFLYNDIEAYIPVKWDKSIEVSSLNMGMPKDLLGIVFVKETSVTIILLESYGSYYERIGYAAISPDVLIRSVEAGGRSHGSVTTVTDWQMTAFEDFAWLQHVDRRTIVVG
jgi:hypothetical protein